MRLAFVASATLSLLLVIAPGLRAQDDNKPAKKKDDKKDNKKKDDKKDDKKEKGDEGDDDDEDKPKKPQEKMPINPFAKAKKGDWSVCLGKMKMNMGGQKIDQKMKFIIRVKDVDNGGVTLTMKQEASGGFGGGGGREETATFNLKELPTVQKYMSMNDNQRGGDGEEMSDWKTEDDKKTVGGKEFGCKKVSCKMKDKMGSDMKLVMWVTDETKGWGLVALTLKGTIPQGGGTVQMDMELKGYGNGDKADFGKKPEEEKTDEDSGDDDGKKDKDKDEKKDDKKDKKKDKKDDDD
jgi:hypothetical protein